MIDMNDEGMKQALKLTEDAVAAQLESERPFGGALATEVLQSDGYRFLSDEAKAECDEMIRQWCAWLKAVAAPSSPGDKQGRITQEDVDCFMRSLQAKNTPWANGCAALIVTLWNDLTEAIERERLANMRADQAEEARDAAVSATAPQFRFFTIEPPQSNVYGIPRKSAVQIGEHVFWIEEGILFYRPANEPHSVTSGPEVADILFDAIRTADSRSADKGQG